MIIENFYCEIKAYSSLSLFNDKEIRAALRLTFVPFIVSHIAFL